MRLDRFLAQLGLGSRKEVKKYIADGLVKVNGETIHQAKYAVDEFQDRVTYLDSPLHYQEFYYILLNKPAGIVSAKHDNLYETVIDWVRLDYDHVDLFPVGRLDLDTTGLLLLTNHGQLAHRLLSPKHHVDKVYQALVTGQVNIEDIQAFQDGIILADFTCQPADLVVESYDSRRDQSLVQVTIHEGKFHQVKRMFQARDHQVLSLHRLAMGPLVLDADLDLGDYRELSPEECQALEEYGLENR